jgi:dipeptidyl aminopeptidase/acylaminoacyl peptidase
MITFLLLLTVPSVTGQRAKVFVPSTMDGTQQPCYLVLPEGFDQHAEPAPLLVSLHTWSGNVEQRTETQGKMEALAGKRGWVYLFPNFRGRNDHPEACGSALAQQDILDAVAWVQNEYPIDPQRIYLAGVSGGGHMTMLMAGRHPDVWAAASAWVAISDLAEWHGRHAEGKYGAMLRKCCGGAPGDSAEVDREYRARSPITHLRRAAEVPLDIAAGIHDGHRGSVPIRHSLNAFNVIAEAAGAAMISEAEIQQLSRPNGRLEQPLDSDLVKDPSFNRPIHLRRSAGRARVTIFEGGHEGIAEAAIQWLARHQKSGS